MHSTISKKETLLGWQEFWESDRARQVFRDSIQPIDDYLWLTRNTESPRQYHLWSLLSLVAAAVSNHCHIDNGIVGKLKLNLGVVLIGRPALRKGSAISQMLRFAQDVPLNIGPTDTAGARHGIMSAMQTRWQEDSWDKKLEEEAAGLSALAEMNTDSIISTQTRRTTRPSSIFFVAKLLERLLTAQTRELLDFFSDGLDGESFLYHTKTGHIRVSNPMINLLGATTPSGLTQLLPRGVDDHNFLARIIFVYAKGEEKAVPIPPSQTRHEAEIEGTLQDRIMRLVDEAGGEIVFTKEGEAEYRLLYSYAVPTLEFRLNAYSGFRPAHLAKLAGIIALLRGDQPVRITRSDVGLAHMILGLTEIDMDGAYVGLDKSQDAIVYRITRELIESGSAPKGEREVLVNHLIRAGISSEDCIKSLDRLMKAGRIHSDEGGRKLTIGGSLGKEKMALYLNQVQNRIEQDG